MLLQKLTKIHAFKRFSIPVSQLVQAGIALGRTTYGSPTLSDQSV
jgi:hypothetical protein